MQEECMVVIPMRFYLIRKGIQYGDMHTEIIFEGQKKKMISCKSIICKRVVRKGGIIEIING
jgi:hypothetical protein